MERNDVLDDLNRLLRDELSAMETYRQLIERNRGEYGADTRFQQLSAFMRDHEQAAAQLRELVQRMGGTAANDSGAWGTWVHTVMGTAKLFGDKTALKALKEGEESGVKDYRATLDDLPPDEVTHVCTAIMTRELEHVRELDRLIAAA
jgi:rubrerythrin